jgi:hypothetical protein
MHREVSDKNHLMSDFNQSLPKLSSLNVPALEERLKVYAVSEQKLALEQRRRYPDLKVRLGAGVDEGNSTLSFGLGSFVLPWWNRNRERIALAKKSRELAKADVEIWMKSFEHQKKLMTNQFNHLLERLKYIDHDWLPLARDQVTDANRLAQLGQLNLILLADAMNDVRAVEAQRDDVVAELSLLQLEWSLLNIDGK